MSALLRLHRLTIVAATSIAFLCSDAAVAGATTGGHTYTFPVHGCRSSYADTHHDYPATDIFTGFGCRFVAPIGGYVDEVSRADRWSPSTDLGSERGGRSVSIVGNDGVRYYGSHLSRVAVGIQPGVRVHRGQTLGYVGHSGDASATHLHFGISWTTRHGIWWVRRGEIWPWRFLDAWRAGSVHRSPVRAVARALHRAGTRVPPCRVDC
jgi:murein DD-endopeptidase MepM/ murein hydrolase activator NlpD